MFYELIYTRCRQGIDILRNGQSITSDGYKVYGCSKEILENDNIDIPFLQNISQAKQSYNDPSFMDDAYLYCVPDKGDPFIEDFHPIHFDPTIKGDFARRPGNYLNDVLIGEFDEIYPFELFNDTSIWVAKEKDEGYYYSTPQSVLPARDDISSPPGQYSIDEIENFIADGRKEALKKAVSFIISQYELDYAQRKFLVIVDESSRNIELWIAAIEYAFSPRMAARIPFATRMDKFANSNRYTINQLGVFQQQINLQDPKQSLRYRAMIVGVNTNDKANANSARPLQNSPFVVLDGKNKIANFDADISDSYFNAIVEINDPHIQFCRDFLNTFDINKPSKEITMFYRAYSMLSTPSRLTAKSFSDILRFLNQYKAYPTRTLKELYDLANKLLADYMTQDIVSSLAIMDWIQKTATIVGDLSVKQKLSNTVCEMFTETLFVTHRSGKSEELWNQIKCSSFANDVANKVSDSNTVNKYSEKIASFSSIYNTEFFKIFVDCCVLSENYLALKAVSASSIGICYRNRADSDMHEIVKTLRIVCKEKVFKALLDIAQECDRQVTAYVVKYLISSDAAIVSSEKNMVSFCRMLVEEGMSELTPTVLDYYIEKLHSFLDFEHFIRNVNNYGFADEKTLTNAYLTIDKRMGIQLKGTKTLAELLQSTKPNDKVKLINSAHILAYDAIYNHKRKDESLKRILAPYVKQGFPSITTDPMFIREFMDMLIKAQIDEKDLQYITSLLMGTDDIYYYLYMNSLCSNATKNKEKWCIAIECCAQCEDATVKAHSKKTLIDVLVDTHQSNRSLEALEKLLTDRASIRFFSSAADEAWNRIQFQHQENGLKKMFGFFKKD